VSTNSLHLHILDAVQEELCSLIEELSGEQETHSQKDLFALLFKNYRYRKNLHHGLRLSYLGNRVLSKHFQSHAFRIEKQPNLQSLVILDNQMKWPYYISKGMAVFYSDNDAAWFKLNGEDMSTFTGYI
jgi:hypothetical protein